MLRVDEVESERDHQLYASGTVDLVQLAPPSTVCLSTSPALPHPASHASSPLRPCIATGKNLVGSATGSQCAPVSVVRTSTEAPLRRVIAYPSAHAVAPPVASTWSRYPLVPLACFVHVAPPSAVYRMAPSEPTTHPCWASVKSTPANA